MAAKRRAYLDIETTGMSPCGCDLTVIGIGLERDREVELVQLIEEDLYEARLLQVLDGVDELYTYNGSRFDLPFIRTRLLVDLGQCFNHRDLMYDCWRHGLKGGLKAVEAKVGIDRRLKDVDGWVAVQLWWDYVSKGNQQSLEILLAYNAEDVVNLRALRRKLGVR
jgi:uncharacterized protein YprB with RNaseH-like and TPR domain